MTDVMNPANYLPLEDQDYLDSLDKALKVMDPAQAILIFMNKQSGYVYEIYNCNQDLAVLLIDQISKNDRQRECIKDIIEFLSSCVEVAEDYKEIRRDKTH